MSSESSLSFNGSPWDYWTYTRLHYRTINGVEYTVVTITDFVQKREIWLDGYFVLPSPGELSKLSAIPNAADIKVRFFGRMPELCISFDDGNTALIDIGKTVFAGQWFPV